MTQSRFAGRGRNAGRDGRGSANGRSNGRGRGAGYTPKGTTKKVGLCADLQHHIFDYGVANAADLMRTTQEKIAQYVGVKYGEDISNEVTNKSAVVVAPPVYSPAILLKHQQWEAHVRRKQTKVKAALNAKLIKMRALRIEEQDEVDIAEVENQIEDITYQQGQAVPYNLTDSEKLEYSNESKTHSVRVATLEKHRGNVYALIYGQCTQILQDKMKQDKGWPAVSVSYKPLELYKLTAGPTTDTSSARLWRCTMRLVWAESVRRLQNHASNMLLFANARAQVIGHNYVSNRPISYRSERLNS
jgi:hypothetical protein